MGLLKFADAATKQRYEHPDDPETWIELRTSLSRGLSNDMLKLLPDSLLARGDEGDSDAPTSVFVIREAPELAKALFAAYVVAWSADRPPSVASYLSLESEAAAWIDSILFQHVNQGRMTADEAKKPTTSPKATRKGTPDKVS